MNQPVLVTGAAGFIGSHLTRRLLQTGYPVVGLDNLDDYYPVAIKRRRIDLLQNESGFQFVEGDIRNTELLNNLFSRNRFKYIMHLAARAGVRPSVEYPLLYEDVNIRGTLNLLQSCRNARVEKFIFASSSSVYGIHDDSPFSEDANVDHPVSPYAASKTSAELFCRTYSYLYQMPVVILRLFTVYGPGQRPEMAIHRFTRQISRGETVTVFGDGTSHRDYTYIDDIVDGFMKAALYQAAPFEIFNLGGGRAVQLDYLLKVIEKALQKKAIIRYADPVAGDVPGTIADISKARSRLGYNPQFKIEEGIDRFIQWYHQNQEIESESFSHH